MCALTKYWINKNKEKNIKSTMKIKTMKPIILGAALFVSSMSMLHADTDKKSTPPKICVCIQRGDPMGKHATFGTLKMSVDGQKGDGWSMECSTLEPIKGNYALEEVAKNYPIPADSYVGHEKDFDKHFAIALDDKEGSGFTSVLIHVGNFTWDTTACILPGATQSDPIAVKKSSCKSSTLWTADSNAGMITGLNTAKTSGTSGEVATSVTELNAMKTVYENYKATYKVEPVFDVCIKDYVAPKTKK